MEDVRLFVGGLDYRADKKDLRAFFSAVGRVADVFTPFQNPQALTAGDKPRNKGFAFVEMGSPEEAAVAVEQLNGVRGPYGRVVSVSMAEKRKEI